MILRLSGVIITPKPTGWSGKSAVIYSIRESPNVPGLQTLRLTILLTYSRSAISGWKISTQFTLNWREKGRWRRDNGLDTQSPSKKCHFPRTAPDPGLRPPETCDSDKLLRCVATMASSDRSRSDRMEPLSGRVVSQMQAVASRVPGGSMSSSSPDVPPHRHSYEVSQHNSQLNMPQSYEVNQHNHQMNVPIVMSTTSMFRITIGNWTFKYLQIPWSLLRHTKRDQMLGMMPSSMHAMCSECSDPKQCFCWIADYGYQREEALGEIDRLQNQAASLVDFKPMLTTRVVKLMEKPVKLVKWLSGLELKL